MHNCHNFNTVLLLLERMSPTAATFLCTIFPLLRKPPLWCEKGTPQWGFYSMVRKHQISKKSSRAIIRKRLQTSTISSRDDIQNLFKETRKQSGLDAVINNWVTAV
jgi:hypothetical protein